MDPDSVSEGLWHPRMPDRSGMDPLPPGACPTSRSWPPATGACPTSRAWPLASAGTRRWHGPGTCGRWPSTCCAPRGDARPRAALGLSLPCHRSLLRTCFGRPLEYDYTSTRSKGTALLKNRETMLRGFWNPRLPVAEGNVEQVFSIAMIEIFASVVMSVSAAQTSPTVVKLLNDGKRCKPQKLDPNTIECNFSIGPKFSLTIAGVGEKGAQVVFEKSDSDGEWYAALGTAHGCIMVKPGKANASQAWALGFISPVSARVFSDWASCARDLATSPK